MPEQNRNVYSEVFGADVQHSRDDDPFYDPRVAASRAEMAAFASKPYRPETDGSAPVTVESKVTTEEEISPEMESLIAYLMTQSGLLRDKAETVAARWLGKSPRYEVSVDEKTGTVFDQVINPISKK